MSRPFLLAFVSLYEFRLICKFNFALFFSLPLLLQSFIALAVSALWLPPLRIMKVKVKVRTRVTIFSVLCYVEL